MQKEKKFEPIRMPVKIKQQEIVKQISVGQAQKKGGHVRQQQANEAEEKDYFQGKTDKQSISQEILKKGYIQSFTDFFYITNQTVPYLFESPAAMSIEDHFQKHGINQLALLQDEEFLLDLKRRLEKSEECTRFVYPDKTAALDGYLSLADTFFQQEDYIVAAYFYKRVIQIARRSSEQQYEGRGQLGYGKCHYMVSLIDQAITILEESRARCEALNLDSVVEAMSSQLIQIYNKMASEYDDVTEPDQINQGLVYYEKCRESAQKSGNLETEGMICHKIGALYLRMNNLQRSIQYQQKFLEIVKQLHRDDQKNKEMEAHASLAKCYLKKGDADEAQKHLDQYYALAKDQKLHNAQSDAALLLAKLYQSRNNTAKSLEYFQQHFDCAKSEKYDQKNRKLIDKARVTYAIAKANAFVDNYIKLVANSDKNLKALLDWKAKKDK